MLILIVEDEALQRLAVADELLLAGHEVIGPVGSTAAALLNRFSPWLI